MTNRIERWEKTTGIEWGTIISGLILLFFVLIGVIVGQLFLSQNVKPKTKIEPARAQELLKISTSIDKQDIQRKKSEIEQNSEKEEYVFNHYTTLASIEIYPFGLNTPQSLIQYCQNGTQTQTQCDQEIIRLTKTVYTVAPVTEAYLYVRAGVSRGGEPFGVLTKNDSIYFFLDNAQKYGGHLLRSKAVWSRENADSTELLFNLNSIPFTDIPYKNSVTPIKVPNLLDVLNQSGTHYIVSFVSTLGAGKIYELKIAYQDGSIYTQESK